MHPRDLRLGYTLLRIGMGWDMLLHGGVRLAGHLGDFANHLDETFRASPLPLALVRPMATVIPLAELLLGLVLLSGRRVREAALGGFALMLLLMTGCGLVQKWDLVTTQLFYVVIFAALVAFRGLSEAAERETL